MPIFDNSNGVNGDILDRRFGPTIDLAEYSRRKAEEEARARAEDHAVRSQEGFQGISISIPEGCKVPTHCQIQETGQILLMIPYEDLSAMMDQAFNCGYRLAVNLYADQIRRPVDSPQKTYREMIMELGMSPDGSNIREMVAEMRSQEG